MKRLVKHKDPSLSMVSGYERSSVLCADLVNSLRPFNFAERSPKGSRDCFEPDQSLQWSGGNRIPLRELWLVDERETHINSSGSWAKSFSKHGIKIA